MRTLPTPPLCGGPATVRIELYTEDSLDACVYTCTAHAVHVTAVVAKAGMHAHPVGMAPGVDRPCGYVDVFPTGTLAEAPAELPHPRWCDGDNCQRRGQHRSLARRVDTNRPEASTVDVALVRALHPHAEPMVRLTNVQGSAPASLVASVAQARVLRYRLADLLDLAGAARNGTRWG